MGLKKRILFIKLTSLGDLIHALPALEDARKAHPQLEMDWIIDEHFQEVAYWAKSIHKVFTTNHRMWRIRPLSAFGPVVNLIKKIRQTKYDLIIDGQGNFKSALISFFTKGPRAGFDKHCVREKIAHLAYNRKYFVSKNGHAIERLRQLFAFALDYAIPSALPDCWIDQTRFTRPSIELPKEYLIFVPNAGWKTKLWPEKHWLALLQNITQKGYHVLLPWGSEEEKARAGRLSLGHERIQALPKLTLCEIGYIIARARACVCMDTGLSHLAAALGVPSITLYGATDAKLIGTSGPNQVHLQASLHCAPCRKKICRFHNSDAQDPLCLRQIHPDTVFLELMKLLNE